MQIVLRVKDDGTAVIEKFGKTSEKEGEKASGSWGKVGKAAGVAAAAYAATAAIMIKSAIDTADATSKTAAKLGLTTEALSSLNYVAKLADVQTAELNTSLQMMTRNLSDAAQGGGAAKYAIADLGLNAQRLAAMRPEQAIDAIAGALDKIPNANDRVRIAMDIFGRSGAGMVNALRGGPEELKKMYAEAQKFGQVIGGDTGRQAELFNDNLTRMKSIVTGTAMQMATALLPTLVELTGKFLAAYEAGGFLHAALGAIGSTSIQQRIAVITAEIELLKKEMLLAGEGWATLTKDDENFGGEVEEKLQAKIAALQKERQLLEEQVKKITEASSTAPPAAPGGAPTGLGGQQIEELLKQYEDVHKRMSSAQTQLAEVYVKDWSTLATMLANKKMSQEQFNTESLALAAKYEADLIGIQVEPQQTARDAYIARLSSESEALAESFGYKEELEQDNYDRELAMLAQAEQNKLDLGMSYDALREQLQREHGQRLAAIQGENLTRLYGSQAAWMVQTNQLMQGGWQQQMQGMGMMLGQMSGLMTSHKKKEFELGKKAAIGQALVNTFLGVSQALSMGFPIGIIFAAIQLAVGLANVNRIRSQQFGGGGGATPTFNANPGTGLPEAPARALPSDALPQAPTLNVPQQPRVTNLNIESDSGLVSLEWLRTKFGPTLEQAQRDGGIVRVT